VNALRAFKLNALDYNSHDNNVIEVTRPNYLVAAIAAASLEDFMCQLGRPLRVQYVGEAGMDGRGLRRDFLTLLVNVMESKLNERRPADVEMHFTAGFFSAIAVPQDNIKRRFVIEHLGNTNFLRGLNGLGLGDVGDPFFIYQDHKIYFFMFLVPVRQL
jgi:hypothetical protein